MTTPAPNKVRKYYSTAYLCLANTNCKMEVFYMEYVLKAFISKLGKEDERFIKQLYTIVYKYLERRDRI